MGGGRQLGQPHADRGAHQRAQRAPGERSPDMAPPVTASVTASVTAIYTSGPVQ